ncbi:hypothetical protein HispidOSU_030154, partial [Sigmodon hispidus]
MLYTAFSSQRIQEHSNISGVLKDSRTSLDRQAISASVNFWVHIVEGGGNKRLRSSLSVQAYRELTRGLRPEQEYPETLPPETQVTLNELLILSMSHGRDEKDTSQSCSRVKEIAIVNAKNRVR